ncbi:MAG: 4Fe-4S binding protein [Candidatus Riflebacteria bacterium]|nr:4Fe-4S binding protein [Candidatus Riflebacteria bacterium]
MSLHNRIVYWYRVLHRYNSFRSEVGLLEFQNPGTDAPVFVSGNYAHTTDQLIEVLRNFPCRLLVADSAGINVWCASGVGDFNENKIIDAIEAVNLSEKVTTRRLILPPLCAAGVELSKIRKETGFSTVWGPMNLDDIPEYIQNNFRKSEKMLRADFPFRDRFENAIGVIGVFALSILLWPLFHRKVFRFLRSVSIVSLVTFLAYDRIPAKYPANKALQVGFVQTAISLISGLVKRSPGLFANILTDWLGIIIFAIDMIGSTPFYKTTIFHWFTTGNNESLFQPAVTSKCIGCGACLEVCPKGIFSRTPEKKIFADVTKSCCECLACVKQCPANAVENSGAGFKNDVRSVKIVNK